MCLYIFRSWNEAGLFYRELVGARQLVILVSANYTVFQETSSVLSPITMSNLDRFHFFHCWKSIKCVIKFPICFCTNVGSTKCKFVKYYNRHDFERIWGELLLQHPVSVVNFLIHSFRMPLGTQPSSHLPHSTYLSLSSMSSHSLSITPLLFCSTL